MTYLSVCSGIEAASVAWHPLGWRPWAFAEIDRFPSAVLAHRWPQVVNRGDMTRFQEWPLATLDLLVGGTPCQSFSVAGLRKGLDDPRGSLLFSYLDIARRYRPRWVVWENVPGVLSVDGGRAFGALLGGLRELGYLGCWRILDAQYFGLAQRRQRVFVVGHLGDWRRAAAVLFERESLSGHPAPRREAGQVAPTVPSRSTAGGGLGTDFDCDGGLVGLPDVSPALKARDFKGPSSDGDGDGDGAPLVPIANSLGANAGRHQIEQTYVPIGFQPRVASGRRGGNISSETIGTLTSESDGDGAPCVAIAFDTTQIAHPENRSNPQPNGPSPSLSRSQTPAMQRGMQVRRLTPEECEALQGFPRGYTAIPYRGKPAADGPRYKALGNSMAVPVMRWIGERIALADSIAIEAGAPEHLTERVLTERAGKRC